MLEQTLTRNHSAQMLSSMVRKQLQQEAYDKPKKVGIHDNSSFQHNNSNSQACYNYT